MKQGADSNVKDIKGKKPIYITKNEAIRELLRNALSLAPIISPSLAIATSGASTSIVAFNAPVLKGMLLKWTNFTSGYQPRFFVLEEGVFSYFQESTGYPLDCRGSISMLTAEVHMPESSDHSRIDVVGSGHVKYSIKARSPADAKKWIWSLMESQRWMKDSNRKSFHSLNSQNHRFSGAYDPTRPSRISVANISISNNNLLRPPSMPLYSTVTAPSGSCNEMETLLYLLQVQMQVQESAVTSVIRSIQDKAINTDDAVKTLSQCGEKIRDTAKLVVALHHSREEYWKKKLVKEFEMRKRWEDVMQKVVGEYPVAKVSEDVPKNGLEPLPTSKLEYEYTTDEDVFYDAPEGVNDTFVESAFGFESFDQEAENEKEQQPVSFPPERTASFQEIENAHKNTGFVSAHDIESAATEYIFEDFRTKLPLDPSKPKPALAVWSFLKSAIGKDLSKITLPVIFNEPLSMLQRCFF